MSKNFKPFCFIFLFSFVIFLVPIKTEAVLTYVGIKLDNVKRMSTNTDFCLKANTKMSVMDGAVTLGSIHTTTDSCAGSTIWSNLVDLTNGRTYTLKLETPLCFGYWRRTTAYLNNLYLCWYGGTRGPNNSGLGESCNQVCEDHGTTPLTGTPYYFDEGCNAARNVYNATCSYACYASQCSHYISSIMVAVNSEGSMCYANPCSYSGNNTGASSNWRPVCTCNYNTGVYNFPFTFTSL